MPAVRVVPALDEVEDGHPRLCLRAEAAPVDQLALQRGEEALAHRVVVAVAQATGGLGTVANPDPSWRRQGAGVQALLRSDPDLVTGATGVLNMVAP